MPGIWPPSLLVRDEKSLQQPSPEIAFCNASGVPSRPLENEKYKKRNGGTTPGGRSFVHVVAASETIRTFGINMCSAHHNNRRNAGRVTFVRGSVLNNTDVQGRA